MSECSECYDGTSFYYGGEVYGSDVIKAVTEVIWVFWVTFRQLCVLFRVSLSQENWTSQFSVYVTYKRRPFQPPILCCVKKNFWVLKFALLYDKSTATTKKNWQSITIFCREALQNRREMIILEESLRILLSMTMILVFMAQQLSSFLWLVSYLQSHSFLKGLFLLFFVDRVSEKNMSEHITCRWVFIIASFHSFFLDFRFIIKFLTRWILSEIDVMKRRCRKGNKNFFFFLL